MAVSRRLPSLMLAVASAVAFGIPAAAAETPVADTGATDVVVPAADLPPDQDMAGLPGESTVAMAAMGDDRAESSPDAAPAGAPAGPTGEAEATPSGASGGPTGKDDTAEPDDGALVSDNALASDSPPKSDKTPTSDKSPASDKTATSDRADGILSAPSPAAEDAGAPPADPSAGAGTLSESRPATGRQRRRSGPRPEGQPALVTADEINHDRDLNVVTARGHVEIDQGGRVVLADTLSYNLKQDVIIAAGNVSITEATGEVTFADYIELTGDMKTTVARDIRELLIDDSRIAARNGTRVAGDRSVFEKGVYTACKPCADEKGPPPLWQVKADRIVHNEVTRQIEYTNAWLDVGGIPIAYTPYMSHADPSVKRESGLLPFSVINNRIVGSGVRTPYFAVVDPYQDLTFTPLITNNDYEQLAVMHRWRNIWGGMKTTFSVADMPQSQTEVKATTGWHLDAYARFDIDDTWRAGYQIQRVSDRYYMPMFGYHTTDPYLTTRPYLEGFGERNYTAIEGYSFEGLSQTTTRTSATPVALPLITYSYMGTPADNGGYWTFDTHGAVISREQGTDSRRVNTMTAWHLPYTAPDGEVYRFSASVRADAYNSNDVVPGQDKMVNIGRGIPNASVDWRYPFTRLGDHSSQTISPIVVASASPYGGNSAKIPNEDSLDFELDDTNIFKADPGTGYDRVLTGPRVAYGGEYTVTNRGLGAADVLLGQMYQAHTQAVFPRGTGLDHHVSDIVGRANIAPSSNLTVQYSFRMNEDNLTLRRSELSTFVGPRALNLQTSYVSYGQLNPDSPYTSREQLNATLTAQATRYWSTQFYTQQKLGAGARPLQTGLRLTYEDECFLVTADAGDTQTKIKTFTAGHYFMFRIYFKTLAQFPVDVF